MASNRLTYASKRVVRFYERYQALQKPERTILELLESSLGRMKVLDIGVGAGRTTRHIASKVKQYVAIDYSEEMIAVCRREFFGLRNAAFWVGDARSMKRFDDQEFDLILFSFNGIDYIPPEDRQYVWKEVQRVGKSGALFFLSTHNLKSVANLFELRITSNPLKNIFRIARLIGVKVLNPSLSDLLARDWAMINDGVHGFGLATYYSTPEEQIRELESAGFLEIRAFSLATGEELSTASTQFAASTEPSISYLCRLPS